MERPGLRVVITDLALGAAGFSDSAGLRFAPLDFSSWGLPGLLLTSAMVKRGFAAYHGSRTQELRGQVPFSASVEDQGPS